MANQFNVLLARDVINGQQGRATANINGSVQDMSYVRNIEVTFTKNQAEVKTLDYSGTQHKAAGWSGSGTMNLYYMTTEFREQALKYAKTGVDTYFTITITNDDPSSSIGTQTVVLYNVNIGTLILAKLDVDSDTLDEDVDFTFDDFDILDKFGKPVAFAN